MYQSNPMAQINGIKKARQGFLKGIGCIDDWVSCGSVTIQGMRYDIYYKWRYWQGLKANARRVFTGDWLKWGKISGHRSIEIVMTTIASTLWLLLRKRKPSRSVRMNQNASSVSETAWLHRNHANDIVPMLKNCREKPGFMINWLKISKCCAGIADRISLVISVKAKNNHRPWAKLILNWIGKNK